MNKVLEYVKTNRVKLMFAASLTLNVLGGSGIIPPVLSDYGKALLQILFGV